MLSIISTLATMATFIPKLIEIGVDVAPLIAGMRQSISQIGASQPEMKSAAEFQALDQIVSKYESDFEAAVQAHMNQVGQTL